VGSFVVSNLRSSLAYSFAGSYVAVPLQLVSTMVIARLLTPAETGVFAVAAVFAALASTFRDFGVTEYLIQEKELKSEHIRASLTVNIAISWLMALLIFAGAPWVADFYRDPGIADVMRVQACNFVLVPFGAVTMAYFRRQLDFRPIFLANLTSDLTSFTVATAGALLGYGYMSLAWSSLAGVAATVTMSLWFRPTDFPRWPGLKGISRVVHFGKFASGVYIIGQIGRGAPEAIIGRASGLVDVALFSRSYSLVELFSRVVLTGIGPVCLPYFAQQHRASSSVVSGYLKSLSYLTAVGWPILAFMIIGAYSAIRIVYGLQWLQCVLLAQLLCAAAIIGLVHCLASELLVAIGEVAGSARLQFAIQVIRIVAMLFVIPFGLTGACCALVIAALVNIVIAQSFLAKSIGLTVRGVALACAPSLVLTLVAVAPALLWMLSQGVSEENFLLFGIGGGMTTAVAWLLCARYCHHPLWGEIVTLFEKASARWRRST
jgi:O-antigen/teichoic acid export membrane protein